MSSVAAQTANNSVGSLNAHVVLCRAAEIASEVLYDRTINLNCTTLPPYPAPPTPPTPAPGPGPSPSGGYKCYSFVGRKVCYPSRSGTMSKDACSQSCK